MTIFPSPTTGEAKSDSFIELDDRLIEQIWNDIGRRVSLEKVREVATAVAAGYRRATVTTFVPIFIRRQTYRRLKEMIDHVE